MKDDLLHVFILNPAAGRKNAGRLGRYIHKVMQQENLPYQLHITQCQGHAIQLAKSVLKQRSRLYCVGGDGTANEVLNGIMQGNRLNLQGLTIIPWGSGNDFVKNFKMENPISYEDAQLINYLTALLRQNPVPIDVAKLNERFFLNVASIGFDAQVTQMTQQLRSEHKIAGSWCYFLALAASLGRMKSYPVTVTLQGKRFSKEVLMISAGKGQYYGGGMKVLPFAHIMSGKLTVCVVNKLSRARLLQLFALFVKGEHTTTEVVCMYQTEHIRIESEQKIPMQADGELFCDCVADIQVIPAAVPFFKL